MRALWVILFALNCLGVGMARGLVDMSLGLVGALACAVLFLTDGADGGWV